jgi:hypothetical protein
MSWRDLTRDNLYSKVLYRVKHMRDPKTFTIDKDVLRYVAGTARGGSESERVNQLLKQAIMREMYRRLEMEAAEFFAAPTRRSRRETKAFQSAAIKSITRD